MRVEPDDTEPCRGGVGAGRNGRHAVAGEHQRHRARSFDVRDRGGRRAEYRERAIDLAHRRAIDLDTVTVPELRHHRGEPLGSGADVDTTPAEVVRDLEEPRGNRRHQGCAGCSALYWATFAAIVRRSMSMRPLNRAPSIKTTRSALRLPVTLADSPSSIRSVAATLPLTVPRTSTRALRTSASTCAALPTVSSASRSRMLPVTRPSIRSGSSQVTSPLMVMVVPIVVAM